MVKTLGHFLKPGNLDSNQIDSNIGSGFIQINDLQLDNQAINSIITSLPVSLQTGSVSSVIARIPWPNPLSSNLGLSIDSLHLTFVIQSPSVHDQETSKLSDSVASVAESFVHDELSSQETAALWESLHADVFPMGQPEDDPNVPGGLATDPFLSNIDETTNSDSDPVGISLFATLFERLLARFEFDATNTTITLVDPDNMSITACISSIQYHTSDDSTRSENVSQFRVQGRTISMSGVTISARNLRPESSVLYTPTRNSSSSLNTLPVAVHDSSPPVSSSSSSSFMDDGAYFAMSQSLAFLPPRQTSPSSSVCSSMYQSAVSNAPLEAERRFDSNEDIQDRAFSPESCPDTSLRLGGSSPSQDAANVMVSFGSLPLLVAIKFPSTEDAESNGARSELPGSANGLQLTVTLGVVAMAFEAWQIHGLIESLQKLQPPSRGKDSSPQATVSYQLEVKMRGLVLLLLPSSDRKTPHSPSLSEFFKYPLVPLDLPQNYIRLHLETIAVSASSSSALTKQGNLSKIKEPACTCSVGDVSVFYIHRGSDNPTTLLAMPILISDSDLAFQYESHHRHPTEDSIDPALPVFGVVDWTASDLSSNGFKIAPWRSKRTRKRTAPQPGGSTATIPPVLAVDLTYFDARKPVPSLEVNVHVIPIHIMLDLGILIKSEISALLTDLSGENLRHPRLNDLSAKNDSDDELSEADTPPAGRTSESVQEREERLRLERLILQDLDLDFEYSGERPHVTKLKKSPRRGNKSPKSNTIMSISFTMIRVQVRCPSPAEHYTRSKALFVDLHDVILSTMPEPSMKRAHFAREADEVTLTSHGDFLAQAKVQRMVAAYCSSSDSTAQTFVSVGSLALDEDAPFSQHILPSLVPRVIVNRSATLSDASSEVVSLNIEIPSVIVDISKPILDGLQYWADDIARCVDYPSSEDDPVQKVAFIRLLLPRTETNDIRPFIIRTSDIDGLIEPRAKGKDEMILTIEMTDVSVTDLPTQSSSLTYLSLTCPRSLTSNPKPMIKLRFRSLVLPQTTAKESHINLTASGFTFNLFPDFAWTKDLGFFAQSPPGTFESVIPSERTHVSLAIQEGAIRLLAPTHPGGIIVHVNALNFATDVVGGSQQSVYQLSIPALSLLAIDDISNEMDVDVASSHRGALLWKAAGFALIANIEDLSMAITQHVERDPATSILINRSRLQIHVAADTLSAVAAFADDFGSLFRSVSTDRSPSLDRQPAVVPEQYPEAARLMRSIDELAFKKVPELGPAPDMIYDDLPTNMDYLDESFGTAAGLRELSDDDLEEFHVEESQPEQDSAAGIVSRVGGETIKLLDPGGIKVTDNYFETLPPEKPFDGYGDTTFRFRIHESDIRLFLYDGYDWLKTRKNIEEEVKDMRRRLAKIRQLVASGQVQDPSAEETGALLYNSIYIGLNRDVGGLEPGAIIAAIDEELKEDAETASQSSWQSLKSPASAKPRSQTIRVHGKRLTRSRSASMEFCLFGLEASVDQYAPGATPLSRTFVTVRDVEILDHIKTSTWKKFLTELRADSRGNVRETDSNMAQLELLGVQPVPGHSAIEARLRLKILPLRLYVDQDAVDFLKSFFSFKDPDAPSSESKGEEIYFQSAEVFPVDLKLDYKPRRVNYRALREGRTIELMNFFHFDGAEMTLRHITVAGVTGWATLGELLNDLWTPDVKATQLVEVISGVAPIRSAVNVGSGVADLVLLPIAQYKKDGRIVRGVQKGATAFVKSTAIEAIKLGARLATGTQVILEQAEGVLGGQFNRPITTETISVGVEDDFTELNNAENDEPTDMISRYAEQPADIQEGVRSAYRSLRRNFHSAAQTILAVPMEVYERSGSEGPVRSVIRAVPIAVLKPMIGASEAVSQTLLGLHNTLDPNIRHENDAKYKRR
ncbi:hypothetical protein H0H93_011909 [Arthromyces matolae]|nr:hypothetical protein H0H93_011909 [Arthromyces matolae]